MKSAVSVVNVLLQNKSDRILLLQRSPLLKQPFLWGLPGGVIDDGESDTYAATRELQEETGIVSSCISITGITTFFIEMPEENVKLSSIQARIADAEVILDPAEHIAYRWSRVMDILSADDLMPALPTIVARSLDIDVDFQDLTLDNSIKITPLNS